MCMPRTRVRPALIVAFSWLLASVMLSLLLVPSLGARGLMWLGLHNALCLIGCGWEIRRAWAIQKTGRGMPAEE